MQTSSVRDGLLTEETVKKPRLAAARHPQSMQHFSSRYASAGATAKRRPDIAVLATLRFLAKE